MFYFQELHHTYSESILSKEHYTPLLIEDLSTLIPKYHNRNFSDLYTNLENQIRSRHPVESNRLKRSRQDRMQMMAQSSQIPSRLLLQELNHIYFTDISDVFLETFFIVWTL